MRNHNLCLPLTEGGLVEKMYDTIPKRHRHDSDTILKRIRHDSDTTPTRLRHHSDTVPTRFQRIPTRFRQDSDTKTQMVYEGNLP